MGCVQSQEKHMRTAPSSSEEAAAARLLAQQQAVAAHKAAAVDTRNINPVAPPPRMADTEVLKRATAFDKLHEEAHKAPSLRDIKVVVGQQNQKLLDGFEKKEAAARAMPKLNDVQGTDVRNSKLFDKLKQFEENDAKVRREPKLEKTFSQREKEKFESNPVELPPLPPMPPAPISMSDMTTVPRPLSTS